MTGIATLARALAEGAGRRRTGSRPSPGARSAAVLLLLTEEIDPAVTFITRAATLRHHAGQVALPGGAVDDTDADRVQTALREAREEIGLDVSGVTVLGELPGVAVAASDFEVTTVVATWRGDHALRPTDPAEVDSVHQITVSALSCPSNRVLARHPSGFTGPAFVHGKQFIWGMTAHLIDWALDLGRWSRPWDRGRVVEIPSRFLRD